MTTSNEQDFPEQKRFQELYNLLHTAVHDLKNPLTTIPVRADLIKLKKHDPELVDKMCDQIKIASLSMVRIIDELLEMGSIQSGKINLMLIKISLVDVVKNVITMTLPLAERKSQKIHFNATCDPIIQGDESKLNEIVDNLINNAIKYAPKETSIYVSVTVIESNARIEIRDEGPGLSPDDMKQLYQRFTRLSAQPTGGENSTGLGLSIVKALVEAHHGKLWAESDGIGTGATFIAEFPLRS